MILSGDTSRCSGLLFMVKVPNQGLRHVLLPIMPSRSPKVPGICSILIFSNSEHGASLGNVPPHHHMSLPGYCRGIGILIHQTGVFCQTEC